MDLYKTIMTAKVQVVLVLDEWAGNDHISAKSGGGCTRSSNMLLATELYVVLWLHNTYN